MSTLVRAAGMRGTVEALRERGMAIEPLMDRLQIPRAALADEELRISLPAYGQLLELASEAIDCPDLGLQIAERQDIGILGPLAIAAQNASTMGEAMKVLSGFLHTHSNGIRVSLHPEWPLPGQTSLRLTLITPSWQSRRQLMDLCLGDLHHFSAFLAQSALPLLGVTLPHAPLAAPQRYAGFFGHPVEFGRTHAELVVPSGFLQQSLSGAVAALHRLSLEYLALAFEGGGKTMAEQVEEILRRALSSTRGRREVVARLLGLHPRTLQRRLEAEGTAFSDIVDAVRRDQARRWLTESEVPLAHVADILGLADQTVLCRNCARWFGRSPSVIRARGLSSAP
ncbi:AraC family transcriptional regulator [Solimonas fluminis]|uniref:AraC family transcriptional regulator n=1 Tax=Solimonas fluminis TaxID=2086571 RepID=A0A2S5TLU4_9GAMM|nr:AraC family transcriptional regulator ligand-binding domain-containing protein [Solimonas fluminis]PPE75970.1 AraC family transcriptional regulator [Solimonas fluminis]